MIKHWKYSICQLLLIICIFKRRKTEDFLILHHCAINSLTVTLSHTTLSREVMIAWRCKAFTALYSRSPSKKLGFRKVSESKDGDCFCSGFHYFSLDFTRVFCLSLRSFPPKDRQTKKRIILGFASLLAELKQLSVPKIGLKWTIDHGGRRSDVPNW